MDRKENGVDVWLFDNIKDTLSFLVGDVIDGIVDLGLQNLANSHVLLFVLPRLSLLNVQPLDQLSPLPLPIRLTFLPVSLDLTDSRGQLRVLLSLQLQLLL